MNKNVHMLPEIGGNPKLASYCFVSYLIKYVLMQKLKFNFH